MMKASQIRLGIFYCIYFLQLHFVHIFILVDDWAYMGYTSTQPVFLVILFAFIVFLTSAFSLDNKITFASIYKKLYYAMFLIPCLVLFQNGMLSFFTLGLSLFSFFLIQFLTIDEKRNIKIKTVYFHYKKPIIFFLMLIFSTLLLLFLVRGGLNFKVGDIYNVRDQQKENVSGFLAYLHGWLSKVVLPITLVYYTLRGKYIFIGILLILVAINFGVVNSKANAILPIMSLIIALWMKMMSGKLQFQVILVTSLCVFYIIDVILGLNLFLGLLVRRGIFSGALNLEYYVQFFSSHTYVFWSNSFLSALSRYPYPDKPGELIGIFLGSPNNHNAGLVASGFMHLGIIGVFFYTLIVAVIIKCLDSFTKMNERIMDFSLKSVFVTVSAHFIINVDLTNALLTHGLIVFILLTYFLSSKKAN